MPGTITKTHGGHEYLYFEYYDGSKTVQKYCGRAGTPKAEWKACKFELEMLESRKGVLVDRIREVKRRMGRIEYPGKYHD